MSVAVAHHTRSSSAPRALWEGAREAAYRGTDLVVIHVVDSLDNDIAEANRAGISDAVESGPRRDLAAGRAVGCASRRGRAGGRRRVGGASSATVAELGPDLLVIGARRRSPMGKAFLGSVAQNIILDADVPVLVVKSPR